MIHLDPLQHLGCTADMVAVEMRDNQPVKLLNVLAFQKRHDFGALGDQSRIDQDRPAGGGKHKSIRFSHLQAVDIQIMIHSFHLPLHSSIIFFFAGSMQAGFRNLIFPFPDLTPLINVDRGCKKCYLIRIYDRMYRTS